MNVFKKEIRKIKRSTDDVLRYFIDDVDCNCEICK